MPHIQNACDGVLTNYEATRLLAEQKRKREEEEAALPLPGARRSTQSTAWSAQQSVAQITEQVLTYLSKSTANAQTREGIDAFLAEAPKFGLTRTEMLALVNSPPRSAVEISLLVEDVEERLHTKEERSSLLALCQRTLFG